jgi:hypothetical protein
MATDGEIHFLETCGRVVLKFLMNATTGSHCFFLFFPLIGGWGVFSVLQCSSWMEDFILLVCTTLYTHVISWSCFLRSRQMAMLLSCWISGFLSRSFLRHGLFPSILILFHLTGWWVHFQIPC